MAIKGMHAMFYDTADDIEKTVKELNANGVELTVPVEDHGFGLVTRFKVPGGFDVQLCQPKYGK